VASPPPVPWNPDPNAYAVLVDDNFHYMDESERYCLGRFPDRDSAVAACKKLVDESLASCYLPGIDAETLVGRYQGFGEDPYVMAPEGQPRCEFSAWTYAEQRAKDICALAEAVAAKDKKKTIGQS
jgi:hypothetical protein